MTAWSPTGSDLKGPAGAAGAAGATGPAGPAGPQGPAGSGAAWGGITGTLSSQADLQAALDLKLNASRLTVGPTPPPNPSSGDLWIDTN